MQNIIKPLVWTMNICYKLCQNYGLAIILFTLISKIVLLPISIWLQYNSIKLVKMQPELNFVKARYYGDKEKVAEEHSKIYKEYKYNPFISIIPTIIQLFLLMGVIEVIKVGMIDPDINMSFMGIMLSFIPAKVGGLYFLSPTLAALSALIMCICQNKSNVIQAEQSKWSQVLLLIISVGLSLYLGFFVSVGVAIYWISSNLLAIVQLYVLNFFINPKKHVDYAKLEESKKALDELDNIGKTHRKKTEQEKENARREKEDYKRFFSVVNKHIVFYSESNGFYKYFSGLIEFLLNKTNLIIHYITSDPNDNIFKMAEDNSRVRAYYITEKKLITLMMKMDADVVLMTMPDLELFHIKRSYVRKDVEYIFVEHGLGSVNLTFRKESLDYFDTIFSPDKKQTEEIRRREELYHLPNKNIIESGYFVLDDMMEMYKKMEKEPLFTGKKSILIAPSYHDGNIVESCLDDVMEQLTNLDYYIVVRPHPQHIRHRKEQMEQLKDKYKDYENVDVQLDFSATDTVWRADLLITDWSDITFEFAFCTHQPVLFINTPMKCMNPDYQELGIVPMNIEIREIFGTSLDTDKLDELPEKIEFLFENKDKYAHIIDDYAGAQVYNIGKSAEVAGRYIVDTLREKKKNKMQGEF